MTTPKSMQQSSQSMNDGLQKMLGEIAQMQALPDADIDFLTQLQQVIVGKIRATLNSGQQGMGGQQSPGGQPGMQAGGTPGVPPSPSPMNGPAMGMSVTGGGAGAPNMDELSRVLGSASAAG